MLAGDTGLGFGLPRVPRAGRVKLHRRRSQALGEPLLVELTIQLEAWLHETEDNQHRSPGRCGWNRSARSAVAVHSSIKITTVEGRRSSPLDRRPEVALVRRVLVPHKTIVGKVQILWVDSFRGSHHPGGTQPCADTCRGGA